MLSIGEQSQDSGRRFKMRKTVIGSGCLVGIGIAMGALGGCGQEAAQVPLTPVSAAERQRAEQREQEAVQTIADAQCDRAQRCKAIGQDAEYATRAHCLSLMRKEAHETVGECNQGIDRGDLAQCVGEIQNQDCGASFDGLQTWVACQSDDLCLG
jgi:hypothetical protein